MYIYERTGPQVFLQVFHFTEVTDEQLTYFMTSHHHKKQALCIP